MTIYPPRILQELKDFHLFLDTNVFIYASKNKDFFDFLISLKVDGNCTFTTIPSVLFEFTQGANTTQIYNERTDFVTSLVDAINPVAFINTIQDFYIIMAKLNARNKSYTDFLLAACIYHYSHSPVALMTTDLKAFPAFFPRTHLITTEHRHDVINFGIYQFDTGGYANAAEKALQELG